MGANIILDQNQAIINGVGELKPHHSLISSDLRASMSLIIAALSAKGKSKILNLEHLRRGYEDIETKLKNIGAQLVL